MVYLRTSLCLHVLLSTSLTPNAFAYAKSGGGVIGEDKGTPKFHFATNLTGNDGCSDSQIEEIQDGFADMTTLYSVAAMDFNASSKPSIEFFGPTNRTANYTDMIIGNLQRAAAYGTIKGAPGAINPNIHVRCDDPMNACDSAERKNGSYDGTHAAYNINNEAHVNFCPEYFKMDGLDKRVAKGMKDPIQRNMLMEYYNQGTLWARMVMHFSGIGKAVVEQAVPASSNSTAEWTIIVTQGAMNTSVLAGVLNERPDQDRWSSELLLKYAYGATRAKLVAELSTQMSYDAANNAENYALYAQARYMLDKKYFYPYLPIMDFSNEATVLTNENLQNGERDKYADFDSSDVISMPREADFRGAASSMSGISSWRIGLSIAVFSYIYAVSSFG